ncbi:MAG: hypothetical protein AAFU53_04140 [Cyanobacteria bacterium J06632_3]
MDEEILELAWNCIGAPLVSATAAASGKELVGWIKNSFLGTHESMEMVSASAAPATVSYNAPAAHTPTYVSPSYVPQYGVAPASNSMVNNAYASPAVLTDLMFGDGYSLYVKDVDGRYCIKQVDGVWIESALPVSSSLLGFIYRISSIFYLRTSTGLYIYQRGQWYLVS